MNRLTWVLAVLCAVAAFTFAYVYARTDWGGFPRTVEVITESGDTVLWWP